MFSFQLCFLLYFGINISVFNVSKIFIINGKEMLNDKFIDNYIITVFKYKYNTFYLADGFLI